MTRPLVVTGIPCASRMIPLESPVLEIGTPGSETMRSTMVSYVVSGVPRQFAVM